MFFETSIELLLDENMRKLKSAQQQMIDQAKHNLANPVQLRFTGIKSKYVEGIRQRELKLKQQSREVNLSHSQRFSITPDSPNNSYEKLAKMNDCD